MSLHSITGFTSIDNLENEALYLKRHPPKFQDVFTMVEFGYCTRNYTKPMQEYILKQTQLFSYLLTFTKASKTNLDGIQHVYHKAIKQLIAIQSYWSVIQEEFELPPKTKGVNKIYAVIKNEILTKNAFQARRQAMAFAEYNKTRELLAKVDSQLKSALGS